MIPSVLPKFLTKNLTMNKNILHIQIQQKKMSYIPKKHKKLFIFSRLVHEKV